MADEPRLFPFPSSPNLGATLDRQAIIDEVQRGLKNERVRLSDAAENQAFLDLDGERYTPRREAETEFDYAGRGKATTGFVHQAITKLCQHTYNPGPQRNATADASVDTLLQRIYEDCHIDATMHEAEEISTLNCMAAIEVKATNDDDRPIDLQIWGGEEFAVFLDPRDQRLPYAVVTLDEYDEQTRYRLWFDDEVYTFVTSKGTSKTNRNGVIAFQQGPPEENPYAGLPFSFVPYRMPVRRFWNPSPGTFLRESEKGLNDLLSELVETIKKYNAPIGIFKNVSIEFNPEVSKGRFLRLTRGTAGYNGDGFAESGEPSAEYLQATIQIESIWQHIQNTMRQIAEAIGVPPTALTLDYSDQPSGISLIIREFPLLTRARQRRPIYQWAESELAKTVLRCYGSFYRKPEFLDASKKLKLLLSWPEPRIPVPGPERNTEDEWEMSIGAKSRVDVIRERYGLTREQALARLKQVKKDEDEANVIMPPEPPPVEVDPNGEPIPPAGDQGDDEKPEPKAQDDDA
jgi:Phage portal protein, SPP1 Gp6-like